MLHDEMLDDEMLDDEMLDDEMLDEPSARGQSMHAMFDLNG